MSCKILKNDINVLSKKYNVEKYNDKFNTKELNNHNIEYFPTMIVYKNNKIIYNKTGVKPIYKIIKELLRGK
jgi:hypothetical protein